ncbi:MAG: BPSL0067 family protein [Candidatus Peribacteria bacterium]|nr:BPSL0067 family protein [Candidatus Peribacteria bacterium]
MFTCVFSFIAVNNAVAQTPLMVADVFFSLIQDEIEPYSSTYNGTIADGWTLRYSYSMEDNFYYYFPSSNPIVDPILVGSNTSISNYYLSVSPFDHWSYGKIGQCVGFIKVVTNNASGDASTWGKGNAFNPASTLPLKGTVLAYFNGQATYPTSGDHHALVYWGPVPNQSNKFYVIDQNWYLTDPNASDLQKRGNLIRKHIMSASGNNLNSLSNYNIVTK